MSLNRARWQRATPPLTESAWPLYVQLCSAQRRAANRFEFVLWITARTRPELCRHSDVEQMKAAVLATIRKELTQANATPMRLTLLAAD